VIQICSERSQRKKNYVYAKKVIMMQTRGFVSVKLIIMNVLECHYTCLSCLTGPYSNCSSCDKDKFRKLEGDGFCNCLPGYFNMNPYPICLSCHYTCLECVN
jgi:hypothetical protein